MKLDWVAKVHRDMELGKAMALQEWAMPTHERPCQFVTVKEAASLLRVSERTLRRLIRSGELRAYWLHRMVRIRWSDIWGVLE